MTWTEVALVGSPTRMAPRGESKGSGRVSGDKEAWGKGRTTTRGVKMEMFTFVFVLITLLFTENQCVAITTARPRVTPARAPCAISSPESSLTVHAVLLSSLIYHSQREHRVLTPCPPVAKSAIRCSSAAPKAKV
jgi:hypothetical protein